MADEQKFDYDTRNRELYDRFQNGDQKALDQLMNLNRPLAMKIANRYFHAAKLEYRPSMDFDDISSLAMIGVWRGVLKWEPERGPLSTSIVWAIQREMRVIFKTKMSVSLNAPIKNGEDEDTEKQDMLPDLDAIDPELAAYAGERCREYFEFMAAHSKPDELKRLQAYVYGYTERPLLRDIESANIVRHRSQQVRAFRDRWLEHKINYYRSVRFVDATHSDPTAFSALMRVELTESLNRIIKDNAGVYDSINVGFCKGQISKFEKIRDTLKSDGLDIQADLAQKVIDDLQGKIDAADMTN